MQRAWRPINQEPSMHTTTLTQEAPIRGQRTMGAAGVKVAPGAQSPSQDPRQVPELAAEAMKKA